jgi:aminoglycoside phosphotransferase (APT) family kinase protein
MVASEGKSPIGTPLAEVAIDVPLVRRLLEEQHPDLANLPIHPVDAGWDNAMFRLGDRFSVRLPRRELAAILLEKEQTWLPQLANNLLLPVPKPYRIGKPGRDYPWGWSILPWIPGLPADLEEPHADTVESFVSFLRSLHVPAPSDAPINPLRGLPLTQRAASLEERIQRLKTKTELISSEIENIWHRALEAPIDVPATWLHGDLHPRNILVENGAIAGIIDWGDMTSGDRATDLASIWMLFGDRHIRQQAIDLYGNVSQATLQRAKGWAIFFGIILLDAGLVDNPRHAVMGEKILCRVT